MKELKDLTKTTKIVIQIFPEEPNNMAIIGIQEKDKNPCFETTYLEEETDDKLILILKSVLNKSQLSSEIEKVNSSQIAKSQPKEKEQSRQQEQLNLLD